MQPTGPLLAGVSLGRQVWYKSLHQVIQSSQIDLTERFRQLYFHQIPATWEHATVTSQTLPRILALAPKGLEGIGIVAAACRASALGIIDFCSDQMEMGSRCFARLARLTANPFGVSRAGEEILDGMRDLASGIEADGRLCPGWSR